MGIAVTKTHGVYKNSGKTTCLKENVIRNKQVQKKDGFNLHETIRGLKGKVRRLFPLIII